MKGILNLGFIVLAAYFAWDYYSFTTDPTSELGVRRGAITEKQAEIAAKETQIVEAKKFYENLETKRAELRHLSIELATMKSTLTENNDIPAFMKLVLHEAKRVGLTVTSLSPLPLETHQYYIEQPFDLTFQGVFVQLIAFLDRIAQAERIVRIEDFSVRPRGSAVKASKYVELEGTLKVRSYVYLGTNEDELAKRGGSDPTAQIPPPAADGTTPVPEGG